MDDNRILDKLDKMDDRLDKIDVSIAEMKKDVAYHIHRTDLAEENTAILKQETDVRLGRLEKWYDKFHFLGWLLFAVLGILSKLDKIKAVLHAFF